MRSKTFLFFSPSGFILSTGIDVQHIAVSQYMVVETINELFQMII